MTREAEAQFFDFCVEQRTAFSAPEWLRFRAVTSDVLATGALLLAGTDWYGHDDALLRVAEQLHPGCSGRFSAMVQATHFDCPRFSSMLKARLRHERAHA